MELKHLVFTLFFKVSARKRVRSTLFQNLGRNLSVVYPSANIGGMYVLYIL
jgi:hypothetical protein